MVTSRLRPALVLAAWTFLVWTTRIRNIWTDESLSVGGQLSRTALAAVFTALALGVVVVWWRSRTAGRVPPGAAPLVRILAGWTIAVWLVRGVQIAVADHSGAFVAVHTALAVVSIAAALWADRAIHTEAPALATSPG